jgi:molecular chaperone HtpG
MQEKGTLSIHTENIFPIIKKFLYSDHEIFLRELVSNGVDACQKLQKLASMGEYNGVLGDLQVKVSFDAEAKTITVEDNGIGMTAEEVKKYINQIAFSGAAEFVEKYKDKGDTKQIIGHFGLGFYSAFMVSSKVEIFSRSYQEGSEAVHWSCEGNTDFELLPTTKEERGTRIVLHINEDSTEFLDKFRLKGILDKYCKFLPIPIAFEEQSINETKPLWTKSPQEIKEEDYLAFYKQLYPTAEDPLFWIHLNVDFPFELTGILYFPKVRPNFELQRNKIQLYSRQVFITDEVKDIVPEFLMLLHGVIDSPDIPLNVSRSYLQADGNVKKINTYITKKVADKLQELFNQDRKAFEEKWDSVGVFVKYGMITDDKFYERAEKFCLLKNTEGKYFTFEEYRAQIAANQTNKNEQLVLLFSNDAEKQDMYIQSARKRSYDVLLMDGVIDSHFIGVLERKLEKSQVKRVDADVIEKLIEKESSAEVVLSQEEQDKLVALFKQILQDDKMNISVQALPPDELPVLITLPEYMRRMKEMADAQGMGGFLMPAQYQVSLNGNHPLIQKVLAEKEEGKQRQLVQHSYDLALLSQGLLSGQKLSAFIGRSLDLVG